MESSSSSNGGASFSLVTGATSVRPHTVASFRLGDNSGMTSGQYEYRISSPKDHADVGAEGHITWDPSYARGHPFFCVAPVRFDFRQNKALWSVGTTDFIELEHKPFQWIEKLEISARVVSGAPQRTLSWEMLDLTLEYADGDRELLSSPCKPKLTSRQAVRRSSQFLDRASGPFMLQQFAQVQPHSHQVVGVQLRGLVTLRIEAARTPFSLGPEDLLGQVLVFTDSSLAA